MPKITIEYHEETCWPILLQGFLEAMREAGYVYLTLEHFARTDWICKQISYDKQWDYYTSRGMIHHSIAPLLGIPKTRSLGRYSGPLLKPKLGDWG